MLNVLKSFNVYSDEEAKEITEEFFQKYDENKDGKVSYEEFVNFNFTTKKARQIRK